jgi:phosphomannomutase / phosphoglucomutase
MSIFKECDIRGVYGEDLFDETAYLLGRAVGTKYFGQTIVLGGDVRNSTPSLTAELTKGLYQSGAHILNIGIVPTPLMYFSKKKLKATVGIMVTASHNPAKYNGFKLMFGDWPVRHEEISTLEEKITQKAFVNKPGKIEYLSMEEDYKDFILSKVQPKRKLKVVIDACNGVTSELVPKLFAQLGYEVDTLYCSFDGNFPNRNPNPAVYSHLTALQKRVFDIGADLGIAFDGDGDRVVFVDNRGNCCESERSFCIFLDNYLFDKKTSVVYDGKSSSVVKRKIMQLGSEPIMERSGHAFIKRTFLENDSELAGEISGHFFFKELGFDDGIYASLKMAQILSQKEESLATLMDRIEKTVITPDLRIYLVDTEIKELMEDLSTWEHEYPVSRLDGLRIEFKDGWILVRRSVTEPCVTVRLEAHSLISAQKLSEKIFGEKHTAIHDLIIGNLPTSG